MTVHCAKCDHQWEIELRVPMLLERATKVMAGAAAAGCPNCGAHGNDVLCGPSLAVRRMRETVPQTPEPR